jgi:hypothetical protein
MLLKVFSVIRLWTQLTSPFNIAVLFSFLSLPSVPEGLTETKYSSKWCTSIRRPSSPYELIIHRNKSNFFWDTTDSTRSRDIVNWKRVTKTSWTWTTYLWGRLWYSQEKRVGTHGRPPPCDGVSIICRTGAAICTVVVVARYNGRW